MFDTTKDTLMMLSLFGTLCAKQDGSTFHAIIDTADSPTFEQLGFSIEKTGVILKTLAQTAPQVGDTITAVTRLTTKRYRVISSHAYGDGELVQLVCSLTT